MCVLTTGCIGSSIPVESFSTGGCTIYNLLILRWIFQGLILLSSNIQR